MGAADKHCYRPAVFLPSPTALDGLLERISTDFFPFFHCEYRVTSIFSIHSLLELEAIISFGSCVVSLDLHICDPQEKGESDQKQKGKSASINTWMKTGRNADGVKHLEMQPHLEHTNRSKAQSWVWIRISLAPWCYVMGSSSQVLPRMKSYWWWAKGPGSPRGL